MIPALAWPSPLPADLPGDLADEAVWLEDTEDGWELVVLGSALPARLVNVDVLRSPRRADQARSGCHVDVEGDQVTITGRTVARAVA